MRDYEMGNIIVAFNVIIASVLGILASLVRLKLPKGNLKLSGAVILIKLVILPALMIPFIVMMGYRDSDLLSALLAYQTPIAVSSYIMAQEAGADGQLAGQLVVFSSVLSIFTLFVTIFILRQMRMLA